MRLAFLLIAAACAGAGEQSSTLTSSTLTSSTLTSMKRVYIDRFAGGPTAPQIRDMVISALQGLGLFQITENEDRADVILRGSGEDNIFTDHHTTSDKLGIHAVTGRGGANAQGVRSNENGGISADESESSSITERKHEATAAVRLVNREGDVIWSTTKESLGGKFRGASADVADKIAQQLLHDMEKARSSSMTHILNPSR